MPTARKGAHKEARGLLLGFITSDDATMPSPGVFGKNKINNASVEGYNIAATRENIFWRKSISPLDSQPDQTKKLDPV